MFGSQVNFACACAGSLLLNGESNHELTYQENSQPLVAWKLVVILQSFY